MVREKTNLYLTDGIILKRQPYRETSLLCRCLTENYGLVTIIASGVSKENSKMTGFLEPFSQVHLELYNSGRSEMFSLRAISFISDKQRKRVKKGGADRVVSEPVSTHYTAARQESGEVTGLTYQKGLLLYAAAELLLQCDFTSTESSRYYDLFSAYLDYSANPSHHPFLVFLRFVYNLFELLGISIHTACFRCRSKDYSFFYPQEDSFLCRNCYRPVLSDSVLKLSKETAHLLKNIYNLKEISVDMLTDNSVSEIKRVILIHLANHYNKEFFLRSLNDYHMQ